MATRLSPARKKPRAKKPARKGYHHGNLREVLIEATLRLVEEGGAEAVTVREAARRGRGSPGAPLPPFPHPQVPVTARARGGPPRPPSPGLGAMDRADTDDPLARLRIVGQAYLRWAAENPTHFAVASNRSLIDYEGSASMNRENGEIQDLMTRLLDEAQRQGPAPATDLAV